MKRLIAIITAATALLLMSVNAFAQSPYALRYKGGNFLKGEREVIEQSQYKDYFVGDEYARVVSAQKLRKTGASLMISGGAVTGIGIGLFARGLSDEIKYQNPNCHPTDEDLDDTKIFYLSGLASLAAGITVLAAGVPCYCVGESRLKKAAGAYNKRNHLAYLTITPAGVSLRF